MEIHFQVLVGIFFANFFSYYFLRFKIKEYLRGKTELSTYCTKSFIFLHELHFFIPL
jgi:hypothetical protein